MRDHGTTRRKFLGAAALTAGGIAGGLGWAWGRPGAWGATPRLRIGWVKSNIHHAPFVYLQRTAEKYGFSVELFDFIRYPDIMLALQKKQLDFGGMGYAQLPIIIEQHIENVRGIAGNMLGATEMVLRTGVKLETWKDYEGKKIAVPANSMAEHHLRADALEHGFDIARVNLVKMVPGPAAIIALKQGEIDGMSAWEPWVSKAVVDGVGYVPELRVWDNSIGRINGLLGANREFAEANRDLTVRFLKVLIEAYRWLASHPEEHARLGMSFTGIDYPVAAKAIQNFVYDEKIYLRQSRAYARLAFRYGLTKFDTSDRIPEAVDYSFLERATEKPRQELGFE